MGTWVGKTYRKKVRKWYKKREGILKIIRQERRICRERERNKKKNTVSEQDSGFDLTPPH